MTKFYGEISKMEAQDDGTIKVWGYASSQAVDSDGEVITAEAMKAAIPDYMKFGAVREMHSPQAAGTAIEIRVEDDGKTFFGAHIVDPVAVKKVQTGVYKGFSIGGSVTERDNLNKSVIKGVKLIEISLVDRPANPEAVLTCFKAEKSEEEQPKDEDKEGKQPSEKASENDKDKPEKEDGEDNAEKAAFTPSEIAALKKMLHADSDGMAKMLAEKDDALQKMQQERDALAAELAVLKKQAEAPKGALMAVGKEEDNGAPALAGFTPITKNDGTLDDVATLIKAAQTGRL